jgi:hypothetical protein
MARKKTTITSILLVTDAGHERHFAPEHAHRILLISKKNGWKLPENSKHIWTRDEGFKIRTSATPPESD